MPAGKSIATTVIVETNDNHAALEISNEKLEPHRIPVYLYELASEFHSYWNMGKDNKDYRFVGESKNLNKSRLVLLQALAIVIKNGMGILGVSTPKSM